MNLHKNPALFQELLLATRNALGIPEAFVEKDYWLLTVLKRLSEHEHRDLFVFKGGTSLSKAYGMIQRFSEDVDLALISEGLSGNQAKSRIDRVAKNITEHLPEQHIENLTRKWSRFRRTVHEYPLSVSDAQNSQMTAYLVLEVNSFGVPHPYQKMNICSYMADFLKAQGETALISEYSLQTVPIQVLRPERTLAEKVLAIVRASYHEQPIVQLQNKIRHLYDLHIMMQPEYLGDFIASLEFDQLLRLVRIDDQASREFQGEWNQYPLTQALIFQSTDALWKMLETTYKSSFATMVYGELPDLSVIQNSIQKLAERLNKT